MPLQLISSKNNKSRRAPNTPLPGIDHERPASYIRVFFGASREYGPEEGWQIVKNKRTIKKARRAARRRAEEARYRDEGVHPVQEADADAEDADIEN